MTSKLRKILDRDGRKISYLQKAGLPGHRAYYVAALPNRARPNERKAISKLLKRPQRELF